MFWKTVRPLFSEKGKTMENLILIENQEIISKNLDISELFNKLFGDAVKNLNITSDPETSENIDCITGPILKTIKKYEKHPSILTIKQNTNTDSYFSFSEVSLREIMKVINTLDSAKTVQKSDIPIKIIKENKDIFSRILQENYNFAVCNGLFPNELKMANVSLVHKKGDHTDKNNYGPVSILPNISKVFERCMFKEMYSYFENILSKFQCGFCKRHSAQHGLLVMLENFKKALDKGQSYGPLKSL